MFDLVGVAISVVEASAPDLGLERAAKASLRDLLGVLAGDNIPVMPLAMVPLLLPLEMPTALGVGAPDPDKARATRA